MSIVVRNVPPDGWEGEKLENRLAFRQWGESPGSASAPGGGGSVRQYSPFTVYGESMIGGEIPCLICGHPSSNCTDHIPAPPAPTVTFGGDMRETRETKIQGDVSGNDDPNSTLYVCPDDVVEEFHPQGSSRLSHRLVARKGETISRARAVQLGLVKGAPADALPNAEIVTKEGASIGLQ